MSFSDSSKNIFPQNFTVLIVDDEDYIIDFFKEAISYWGYNVVGAQNAVEALDLMRESRVHLLITDNNMENPDDGMKLALRAREIFPDTIVFLMTGQYVDDETLKFCENNYISFLQKPIRTSELKILIKNTVGNYNKQIEYKSDIEAARKIIESTFPKSLPSYKNAEFFSIYKPVFDIGGDFYDFVRVSEEQCIFYLCDVQGHGIHSAIFSNTIRIFFRAFIETTKDLSEIAARLNNSMCSETHSKSMATAFFSDFNPRTGDLSYVNAGHEIPLLYKAASASFEEIEIGGTILAIFNDLKYEKKTTRLSAGDIFFLYTDGVCDNYNINFQGFKIDSVREIIEENHKESAEDIGHKIFSGIQKHLGGNPQNDDMAFIILKMRS